MNMKRWLVLSLAAVAATVHGAIEVAGELLVNVDVASLSAWTPNTAISAWTNSGSVGGLFVPAVSGTGAVYQANVGGTPAVTFAGSANSVMTNTVPPPASLLGQNTIWSAEIWVLNPTLQSPEDQFAWTDRGSWVGSSDGTCMEIRYCSDANNAVEHYNSTCNIPWSGNPPQAGIWHHIVITRDASGVERLYADGALRTTKTPPISNLRSGAPFAMGGVRDRAANNWQMLFSGSLAKVRVHSGTLSGAQVLANYQAEGGTFQRVWAGASGQALPWSDPANWLEGNVGTEGQTVFINNGGTAVLASDLTLNYLYPVYGGLTLTDGAKLTMGTVDSVYLASGNPFALTVASGLFRVPGSANMNLYMGNSGGAATVSVGGSGASAVIDVDRDTILANSSSSVGEMTVGDGAGVYNSNGWFYVANSVGARGTVTISGGQFGFRMGDKSFVVNASGARGTVNVNGGLIDATGDIQWSAGTATNASYGAVYLNGGTMQAKRFYGVTTAGTNLLYLNGGTVKARDSRTDFMYNLRTAYVQAGGAVFEIPSGVTVTAAQGLTEDPASTGGGLAKFGAGRITFSGANTFTGDIAVQAGDLFFNNASGLAAGYAGAVSVANEGSVGYSAAGGATLLAGRLTAASSGYLTLFAGNAADDVDFSALPDMKLAFQGVPNYTGTFTPYPGRYTFKIEGSTFTNAAVLTDDGATPGRLTVTGVSGGAMVLTGDSTFTGGAEIDAATVTLGHVNALGIQATPGVPDVELRNGAALRFVAAMDINAFVANRLTTTSSGFLLVGAANAAQDIDLSAHPGIVVGSAEFSLDYTGTLTPSPAAGAYRLGGGNTTYVGQSHRGLSVSNLADSAGATPVVIGAPGIVELKTGNTYSGGTVVTNRGVLFIKEDGLGAVPPSADAQNLYINNGVIRSGSVNFSLNANRGVAVGPAGMELHPWGGYSMTVLGNLSGTGPVNTTDSGNVTFGGSANTYQGGITIGGGGGIRIGNGANFSWPSTVGITNNSRLFLNTDSDKTFSTPVTGSGAVRKEGTGALTLATPMSYAGKTFIDTGVLKVSATNILPRGSGRGVVEIAADAALDAAGGDLLVGGLSGAGVVSNSGGGEKTLYMGETNVAAYFSGTVDPSLAVVKIGAGTQTLASGAGAAENVTVQAGTLGLLNSTLISGSVSVASGATLAVSAGEAGLYGEFFKLSAVPVVSDFVSLAAVNAFLAGRTPHYVTNSTYLGESLDMGATASGYTPKFPPGYNASGDNNFVVRWSGLFYAAADGDYGFATASDDGSMVFINGEVAFDNNAMQSYTPADRLIYTPIYLTKGYHEIVIVMYEASGDQGLTVWLTPPGGSQILLPNALLFTGSGEGDGARIGTLDGSAGSTLAFGSAGAAVLKVGDAGDMAFHGRIIGAGASSRFVKESAGVLSLSAGGSDYQGVIDIRDGSLVLTNGPSTLGTLVMAEGVETRVYGQNGLDARFYNLAAASADYTMFLSLSAINTYLSGKTPNFVTNSLAMGEYLDTGESGVNFPGPYTSSGGSRVDLYEMYLSGKIFLNQAGTYTFGTRSDDGSTLLINGTLVVNNGFNQGMTTRYGTITLEPGFHDIMIPYRENTGGAGLRVYIAYPGGPTNMMPQSILFAGAVLRGLAGEAGSALNLGATSAVVLEQNADTLHAGTLVGGTGSFIQKGGTGTLTLTDDNAAYQGGFSILGGVIRVGDGGMTGALGPTAWASVGPSGTLVFDRDGVVTVGGVLSGTGLIRLDGPGEVYLTASSVFAGTVQVNNGRLTLAPGAALGSGATVTNAASVEVETTGTRFQSALAGALSGEGELVVSGSGMLVLNRENNYAGVVRVQDGATLRVSKPVGLGGGADVALEGGTLAILPDVVPGETELVSALDQVAWTRNGNASWVTRYDTQWAQLTPNSASQAGSVFSNAKVEPSVPWYAAFRYEVGDHPASAADGIAFVLQNDARGATALGSSGGAIGVNNITPSYGIFFNIYGTPSAGWIVNGAKTDAVSALNGIILTNGVDVALAYDGVELTLTLTQGAKVATVKRAVDLNAHFSGGTTHVGFTGGTGGSTAQQFVGNFSLYDALPTSTAFDNTVTVADGQTGTLQPTLVVDDGTFTLTGITLGADATLNVSPAASSKADAGYVLAAGNVMVTSGTGTVSVAANGSGAGVLALERLTVGPGARLVVTGAVSVPGGVLTVVVPTPVPRGVTHLADFTGATWVGGVPEIVLVDADGAPVEENVFLRNGRLFINTVLGTTFFLR